MARIPVQRPEELVRLWIASLAAAAVLVIVLAWLAGRDPSLAGDAQALSEARALLPLLSDRRAGLERSLAEGTASLAPRRVFRTDAAGTLADPVALPAPRLLVDEAAALGAAGPSPAGVALREASLLLQGGDPGSALRSLAESEALLEPGEQANGARLALLRADALLRLDRPDEAAGVLADLCAAHAAAAMLDGSSLHLVARSRLAAALEACGRVEDAARERETLLSDLLYPRLPLPAGRCTFEAELLAAQLGRTVPAGTEARLRDATALTAALAAADGAHVLGVGAGLVAYRDPGAGSGCLYEAGAVRAHLVGAWEELLPPDDAFRIVPAEAVPAGKAVMGVLTGSEAFGEGWRLVLDRPEAYSGPAARRQLFLAAATSLFVAALLAVGWLGARALRRRAELERLRSEFVASVSHELRTPAASIGLLAENLAEGRVRDDERQQEYFVALRRDAARLQRLVADVLDMNRLERGAFRVEPELCDPAALLQRVASEQRHRLEDAGLDLELHLEDNLPELPLDADAVERALLNLLENARKYASGGGVVKLCAARGGAGLELGSLHVCVEDHGPGIPEAWRERIFDTFVRGPAPRDGAALSGAGLGLALVRETVRAHGGSIEVRPGEGGRGSCFLMSFPIDGGASASASPAP